MEYTSEFDSGSGICTVSVNGDYVRDRDSVVFKRWVVASFAARGWRRFLFDLRQAQVRASTMSTYEAAIPAPEFRATLKQVRTAVLLSRVTQDDQFFENVTVNRGYQLRVFDDAARARAWLQAPDGAGLVAGQ